MANYTTFVVSFGSSFTGLLGTVGYRFVDATGGDAVARTTAGVYEIGGGAYGVQAPLPPASALSIEWDTGVAPLRFAHEDLLDYFNKKVLINRQETNPATGRRRILEEDDSTVMVEGDIFEDVAGATPYSATAEGIDRSDRMS
jgi:hypothetical protein